MGEKIQRGLLLLSAKKNFIGLKRKLAVLDDAGHSSVSHLLIVGGYRCNYLRKHVCRFFQNSYAN
jgi:hypothetical protein